MPSTWRRLAAQAVFIWAFGERRLRQSTRGVPSGDMTSRSAISGQRSAVIGQRSEVGGRWTVISTRWTVDSGQWTVANKSLPADGDQQSAARVFSGRLIRLSHRCRPGSHGSRDRRRPGVVTRPVTAQRQSANDQQDGGQRPAPAAQRWRRPALIQLGPTRPPLQSTRRNSQPCYHTSLNRN